ncbi:MAG: hypothetical protein JO048_11520 [Methylobacteriaceae bacterium]|nr:hypothetical protein [Methylobacteriaceae bacterium]
MTRLLRTIRLDPSDTFVFERAAEPGEWAVTGSFLFLGSDPGMLAPKVRTAFRSGFLGLASLGFSTLAVVSEASAAELEGAVGSLARHFVERFGAPGLDAAREVAREEIAYASSLCGPPVNTILALRRALVDGEITEEVRILQPRSPVLPGEDRLHLGARAFEFAAAEDEPAEHVDLPAFLDGTPR